MHLAEIRCAVCSASYTVGTVGSVAAVISAEPHISGSRLVSALTVQWGLMQPNSGTLTRRLREAQCVRLCLRFPQDPSPLRACPGTHSFPVPCWEAPIRLCGPPGGFVGACPSIGVCIGARRTSPRDVYPCHFALLCVRPAPHQVC